jgi:hypothetical protein
MGTPEDRQEADMPFIETKLFELELELELGVGGVSPQRWGFSSEVTS